MSIDYLRWIGLFANIITAFIFYKLGVRNQKNQILREYVTERVKDEYPALYAEIKSKTVRLDNFLERVEITHGFTFLDELYQTGRIGLMKRYHKDLFFSVDRFKTEVAPKYEELVRLNTKWKTTLWKDWASHLEYTFSGLPDVEVLARNISHGLIRSPYTHPFNVLPNLLNGRNNEAQDKIKRCLGEKFVSMGEESLDTISNCLVEGAKAEVQKVMKFYMELKEQNDRVVRDELLPLLQKYITSPI